GRGMAMERTGPPDDRLRPAHARQPLAAGARRQVAQLPHRVQVLMATSSFARPLRHAAILLLLAAACSRDDNAVWVTGAGATFPYPVYSKWFHSFHDATGHQINYQSVGSGAGVMQYARGTIDFGAT